MGIKIGIISPNLSNLAKTAVKDPNSLWFNEMEAAWAYLINNPLKELHIHPDIFYDLLGKKYCEMIAYLHPDVEIKPLKDAKLLSRAQYVPGLIELFDVGRVSSLYQPIIDCSQGKVQIYGFECLSRFCFDQKNLSPEFVFDYAQEKLAIDKYDRACIDLALSQAPHKNGLIFINVRPQTLISQDFESWLITALKKYQLVPKQVVLEITEQNCHILEQAIEKQCQHLRSLGIKLAIDDFGTGLANLSLLQTVKPHYLKISGRFSKGIHQDWSKQNIIKNILDLAQSFNIKAVIECVESEEEWLELKKLGAVLAQGFYFHEPMTRDEVDKLSVI